eukprot:TRINITY_DN1544_c0_g3_i1.p1 TRINITY_DN1544_c0_g3~~TRINITY_DN1544_c0_g3_i1.p1  ORF type:complete len:344 (+),score=76.72 TRINITY_DN1544_c0_g3_i1:91-1122(+)
MRCPPPLLCVAAAASVLGEPPPPPPPFRRRAQGGAGGQQWPQPGSGGQRSLRDLPAEQHEMARRARYAQPRRHSDPPPQRHVRHPRAPSLECRPVEPGVCEQTFRLPVGDLKLLRRVHGRREPGAGVALASRIAELDLADKAVVEVSAGVGLISAVAARKGARVTATDADARALPLLQRSLQSACGAQGPGQPATECPAGVPDVIRLDWGGWGSAPGSVATHAINFGRLADYVFAADAALPGAACTDCAGLGWAMQKLAAPSARLLYAHTLREPRCDEAVDQMLRRRFLIASEEVVDPNGMRTLPEGEGGRPGHVVFYFMSQQPAPPPPAAARPERGAEGPEL